MWWIVLGAVMAGTTAGFGLVVVNRRLGRGDGAARAVRIRLDVVVAALANTVAYSILLVGCCALALIVVNLGLELPAWLWGAGLGLGVAGVRWAASGAAALYRWATRRPSEVAAPRFLVRRVCVEGAGFAAVGAGAVPAAVELADAGRLLVGMLPVFVAFYPLYDAILKPWLLFGRAGRDSNTASGVPSGAAVQRWVDRIAARHRLGDVRLLVLPGGIINAFAVGAAPNRRWIVVGRRLWEDLDEPASRAVVAHELAHVIRHDTVRLLLASIAGGIAYALVLGQVFRLWDAGHVVGGLLAATLAGTVCLGLVPGLVSRRIEFGADRLAVDLLGDPTPLCVALERLAQLKREPVDREHLTHPSVADRIKAIRATAT
ncbi:MAG TPA: M48 family metalloprotease [Longimicrobiales bacterium]